MYKDIPLEDVTNNKDLKFSSLRDEKERIYLFPNGKKFKIKNPLWFNCSASGGHRIYAADGWSYYIQPKEGWVLKWEVKDGCFPFAF